MMGSLSLSVCVLVFHRTKYVMSKVPEFKPHSIRSYKHKMGIIAHKTYLCFNPRVNRLKLNQLQTNCICLYEHPFCIFFSCFTFTTELRDCDKKSYFLQTKQRGSVFLLFSEEALRTKQNIMKI